MKLFKLTLVTCYVRNLVKPNTSQFSDFELELKYYTPFKTHDMCPHLTWIKESGVRNVFSHMSKRIRFNRQVDALERHGKTDPRRFVFD